jgi:hypothetical protein
MLRVMRVVRMSVRMSVRVGRRRLLEVRLRVVLAWAWVLHHWMMWRSTVHDEGKQATAEKRCGRGDQTAAGEACVVDATSCCTMREPIWAAEWGKGRSTVDMEQVAGKLELSQAAVES